MLPFPDQQNRSTNALPLAVFALGAFLFIVELSTGTRYGLFRDELYYLACADHLALGYVDHPPLSIALLALITNVFGDALPVLRAVPALFGGANVVLAAAIARALGGGRFACTLAALSFAIVPFYLATAGIYSMNVLDVFAWASATLLLARMLVHDDGRCWLWLGLVVGMGLLNKLSMLFFLTGLSVAVLLTPALRRQLTRWPPWGGLALSLVLFAPHVFWQVMNGWPTLEFIHNASAYKNIRLSPLALILAQIELIHPFNAPLWLGGLGWLLFSARGGRFRALGIVWLVVVAILAVQGAKGYYLGASFALLLPAGAVGFEHLLERKGWRWPRVALPVVLASGGVAVAPLVMPVLPVEQLISYQRALGLAPHQEERSEVGPLPQLFADRFGWTELTASVAQVMASLPAAERDEILLIASNYGEASALNYFGRPYHLPRAVSTHNSYFHWGPGREDADLVISVGTHIDELKVFFEVCTQQPRLSSPYAMPYESASPIVLCRGLKTKLSDAWQQSKTYI